MNKCYLMLSVLLFTHLTASTIEYKMIKETNTDADRLTLVGIKKIDKEESVVVSSDYDYSADKKNNSGDKPVDIVDNTKKKK